MAITDLLRSVALFSGLHDRELEAVAGICQQKDFPAGSVIIKQGEMGHELYIIQKGQVDIVVMGGPAPETPVVVLGKGQIMGEMSLLDMGYRSATARAATPTTVQIVKRPEFIDLCDRDHYIGYQVMRNLAADLSFKLRQRNLATM